MPTIIEFLNTYDWNDSTSPCYIELPSTVTIPVTAEEITCNILFFRSCLSTFNPDLACGNRLNEIKEVLNVEDLTSLYGNLSGNYYKAVVQECIHELLSTGPQKRNSAIQAAIDYETFIFDIAKHPNAINYWILITTAIERARALCQGSGRSLDQVVFASIKYVKCLPREDSVLIYRSIAIAAARGVKRHANIINIFSPLFQEIWQIVNSLRNNLAALTHDILPLASLVGATGFRREISAVLLEYGASVAVQGEALVATGALYQAAKFARSCASDIHSITMKIHELIYPETKDNLIPIYSSMGNDDITRLSPLVNRLISAESLDHSWMLLGSCGNFLPRKIDVEKEVNSRPVSLASLLCSYQPLGEHGPTNYTESELTVYQETEKAIFKLSSLLRTSVFENPSLSQMFDPASLSGFLVESQIVPSEQMGILQRGLHAWREKDNLTCGFILIPIAENAFTRACSILGENSIVLSRTENASRKTGDSIVKSLLQALGEDWAFIFEHIWAREGAIRHSYCHGFINDERTNIYISDITVFCLIGLAYETISKSVLDLQIRESAYAIWEKRGRPIGDELAHWLEAERQIKNDLP